jgi:hypothetical protein
MGPKPCQESGPEVKALDFRSWIIPLHRSLKCSDQRGLSLPVWMGIIFDIDIAIIPVPSHIRGSVLAG